MIGVPHFRFDETDSTNSRALEYANDSALDGAVFQARVQTAGRGQYGRVWQAQPDEAILLSALLFPPPELCRPVLLTALAAVAACRTVAEVAGLAAQMKWPNDVLVGGKKLCGILIESHVNRDRALAVVAGIGFNLNQSAEDFAGRNLPDATSLRLLTGIGWDVEAVTAVLLRHMNAEYKRLRNGDIDTLQGKWRMGMDLLGKDVTVELADGNLAFGELRTLGFDGVTVCDRNGHEHRWQPEAIRHIRMP